jgi:site-specific recombinase
MGWFAQFKSIWQRLRSPFLRTPAMDVLLAEADAAAPIEVRLQWLCDLLDWIRRPAEGATEADVTPGKLQAGRVRFLLQVLDRNPGQRAAVARMLRSILRDTSALDLFCETGLPREHGFFSEVSIRLSERLLPDRPYSGELGMLFDRLFPHEADPNWIERLDETTLKRLEELLQSNAESAEPDWNNLQIDMEEALVQLAASVRITGTSLDIRTRITRKHFRELPFFKLTSAVEALLAAKRVGYNVDLAAEINFLRVQIDNCGKAVDTAYSHLEEFGVSTEIVYQLARIDKQLQRMETLLELLLNQQASPARMAEFIAQLIREHQAHRGIRSLLRGNLELLSRKMVERTAETGEHYIARDRKQYNELFAHAAGGGGVMGIVTWLKFGLGALHLPLLLEGLVFGFNYACSFVFIQLCGFTLATKQPATTAPALAARMHNVRDPATLEKLVDEIVCLVRSQMGAIIGNLAVTFPLALFIAWMGNYLLGEPMLGLPKAEKTIHSLSLFGFTPLYAAFTGVLLWLTSMAAGFADNWFAYHRLRSGMANSPRLRFILGASGAAKVARYLDDNIAGLTSNILLGFLLGLVPAFGLMMGLPIDVRHVTLSTGQFGASIFTMGSGVIYTSGFWLALCGILAVGVINVSVSFSLAMWVAIRARQVSTPERHAIYRALWDRLNERPFSFLWPRKDEVVPAAASHAS